MEALSNINIIKHYFPETPENTLENIDNLYCIYKNINTKINLISRKDIGNFYLHHLLHSLSIAKIFPFVDNTNILDVGTGGGLPGIPLAIFFPNVNFTLVDSIKKKIDAVSYIIKSLGLQNINLINTRVENIHTKFDYVVSRAVGSLNYLTKIAKKNINTININSFSNGFICLKGGNIADETNSINYSYDLYDIHKLFSEEFFKNKFIVHIKI